MRRELGPVHRAATKILQKDSEVAFALCFPVSNGKNVIVWHINFFQTGNRNACCAKELALDSCSKWKTVEQTHYILPQSYQFHCP